MCASTVDSMLKLGDGIGTKTQAQRAVTHLRGIVQDAAVAVMLLRVIGVLRGMARLVGCRLQTHRSRPGVSSRQHPRLARLQGARSKQGTPANDTRPITGCDGSSWDAGSCRHAEGLDREMLQLVFIDDTDARAIQLARTQYCTRANVMLRGQSIGSTCYTWQMLSHRASAE